MTPLRRYAADRIGRKRTLEELDQKVYPDREPAPSTLDYWTDAERWQELGRQVQRDAAEERRTGVAPAGAHGRLASFRALRKRLDRRAR